MRSVTKFLITGVVLSVAVFLSLNALFHSDGYYYSLESCERSFSDDISEPETLVKISEDDAVFEILTNDAGDFMTVKIKKNSLLGLTRYKVDRENRYSLQEWAQKSKRVNWEIWEKCPGINLRGGSVLLWCITQNTEGVDCDNSLPIDIDGEPWFLCYKTDYYN